MKYYRCWDQSLYFYDSIYSLNWVQITLQYRGIFKYWPGLSCFPDYFIGGQMFGLGSLFTAVGISSRKNPVANFRPKEHISGGERHHREGWF